MHGQNHNKRLKTRLLAYLQEALKIGPFIIGMHEILILLAFVLRVFIPISIMDAVIVIGARLLALRLRIGKQRIPVGLPRRLPSRSRWGILGRPLHQRVNFTANAQVI